jgi:hypothetical protein
VPKDLRTSKALSIVGEISNLKVARWLQSRAPRAAAPGKAATFPASFWQRNLVSAWRRCRRHSRTLDDELMYLIGPMQELNYPVYLMVPPE